MTCFWDALRNKLNISMDNMIFVIHLKNNNTKENNILWNDEKLSTKQVEENYEHIKNFNEKSIFNGYDCSICDPFLILICNLYNININHNYNGYTMKYLKNTNFKTLHFSSDTGHFW